MLTYLCLTHSPLIALRFCFLPHFVLCLLPGIILRNTIYISLFTLCFGEIHLIGFLLSRDVFVLTRIKTRVVFLDPPLLTPGEGPSLETSIFPLSFQVHT